MNVHVFFIYSNLFYYMIPPVRFYIELRLILSMYIYKVSGGTLSYNITGIL